MPKKSAVEIFTAMADSLRSVLRNKETFPVDVVENTYAGKKRWGIVFYGVKSKRLAYYSLGYKEPIGALTLDALGTFISEHGIPRKIITDHDGKLDAGKKWKDFIGRLFVPLCLSETDKHNHNLVKRAIQNFKAGLSKIRNDCGAEVLAYHWEAIYHICRLNNFVAWASLGNRLPYESFWGETPDISMIRFKFWELVYYQNWTDTESKVLMNPGRFMGFSWDIGDPMNFKVLQCHGDTKKRAHIMYRGAAVPCSLDASGYNSALQPKSDAYFPDVRSEDGGSSKTTPSPHQGIVDPPDNFIPEGGGKRRKLSSLYSASLSTGLSTADSAEAEVKKPSLADDLPVMANQGYGNEEGATDKMEWAAMEQEEVQDQLKNTDEIYHSPVEILSYYWIPEDGMLMLKTSEIYGLDEDMQEADTFLWDYAVYLTFLILRTTIGLKMSQNTLIFQKAKEWREWAVKFVNVTKKLMARLVRIFGKDSLEEILGSQVTIAMMRPLISHRIFQARLKKPSGRDRRSPNNSGLKYGISVPGNAKEAIQFDQDNGNLLWYNAIFKLLEVLISMEVFKKFPSSLRKARAKGFQFAPLMKIFDVKVDLRRKARLVIGGHVVNSNRHKVYASTMKSVSARILMTIAAAKDLEVMTGDIGNAYLHTETEEKVYTRAGPEIEAVGL